jgi:hypothetical protein
LRRGEEHLDHDQANYMLWLLKRLQQCHCSNELASKFTLFQLSPVTRFICNLKILALERSNGKRRRRSLMLRQYRDQQCGRDHNGGGAIMIPVL